jgi:hypothetical protein
MNEIEKALVFSFKLSNDFNGNFSNYFELLKLFGDFFSLWRLSNINKDYFSQISSSFS